jgi:hypothetical protein
MENHGKGGEEHEVTQSAEKDVPTKSHPTHIYLSKGRKKVEDRNPRYGRLIQETQIRSDQSCVEQGSDAERKRRPSRSDHKPKHKAKDHLQRGGKEYLRESPESDIQRLRKKARSKQKHKPGSDQNKPTCWKNPKMRRKPNKLAKEPGKSKQQQTKNKHFHNLRDPNIIASLAQSLFFSLSFSFPFVAPSVSQEDRRQGS